MAYAHFAGRFSSLVALYAHRSRYPCPSNSTSIRNGGNRIYHNDECLDTRFVGNWTSVFLFHKSLNLYRSLTTNKCPQKQGSDKSNNSKRHGTTLPMIPWSQTDPELLPLRAVRSLRKNKRSTRNWTT